MIEIEKAETNFEEWKKDKVSITTFNLLMEMYGNAGLKFRGEKQ